MELESFENFFERKKDARKKEKKFYDVGKKGNWYYQLVDMVFHKQSNSETKYLTFEKLRLNKTDGEVSHKLNEYECRLGYYMLSPTSKKWTWGQYCTIMPSEDLTILLQKAKDLNLF